MSSFDFVRAMEDGLASILRCAICQERYNTPKLLPCHHTFCQDCLDELASGDEAVCPECITNHKLPFGIGAKHLADDTKMLLLLALQERWLLGQRSLVPPGGRGGVYGDNTDELNSLKAEFHRLRSCVNEFNRCPDLWECVLQQETTSTPHGELQIAGVDNKGHMENAVALLRKRRLLLHQKLDEFLKEETGAIQARVKYEFVRAGEYCSFVEGKLKDFENQPAEMEMTHMAGQCMAISQQAKRLLSSVCEQTATMPLKLVKASDDVKSSQPVKAFYGVDVAVQVALIDEDLSRRLERTHSLPPIGYVPPLRSRRSSTDSDSTVCSRKSVVSLYNDRFSSQSNDNSLLKPKYYGDVHKMKVFGRSWFQTSRRRADWGPSGLTVARDSLVVVTDSANGCLRLCTSAGLSPRRLLTHDGVYTNLGNPQAVCVDLPQRHLYVTDKSNACVVTLDIDTGEDVNTITCAGHKPIGVALDTDSDTLYICCEETHSIVMYRTDGTLVGQIGERGRQSGQFLYPHSLAISPDNRLWVTDTNNNRVQVFTLAGKFLKTVGSRGSGLGQLCHPKGITVDDRGFVLVADTGNQRVQIFDSAGKSLLVFGREDGHLTGSGGAMRASSLGYRAVGLGGSQQGAGRDQHAAAGGPVGVATTGSNGIRGKIFVSYQGDPRIVAYLVQFQKQ